MKITPWTQAGYRVTVRVTDNGATILNCEAPALAGKVGEIRRRTWLISQLVVPGATPRTDGDRLVSHWLNFYNDPELSAVGLTAFREAFQEVQEQPEEPEPSPPGKAGGQGIMH